MEKKKYRYILTCVRAYEVADMVLKRAYGPDLYAEIEGIGQEEFDDIERVISRGWDFRFAVRGKEITVRVWSRGIVQFAPRHFSKNRLAPRGFGFMGMAEWFKRKEELYDVIGEDGEIVREAKYEKWEEKEEAGRDEL